MSLGKTIDDQYGIEARDPTPEELATARDVDAEKPAKQTPSRGWKPEEDKNPHGGFVRDILP